jgi:hypothetical protein
MIGDSRARRRKAQSEVHYYFVVCASEDRHRIAPLIESAELDGHRFWIAQRAPRSPADIAAALDRCAALIVFCSDASLSALSLYRAVARAAQLGKPIVPVALDGGALPGALLYHVSVNDVIDGSDPDWRFRFARTLEKLDGGRRRMAPAPVLAPPPAFAPPAATPVVVHTVRTSRRRAPQRRRASWTQRFINAFAAGVLALFGFAFMELTGGPPTQQEIQDIAAQMEEVATGTIDAT